jgi:hypothetical protein
VPCCPWGLLRDIRSLRQSDSDKKSISLLSTGSLAAVITLGEIETIAETMSTAKASATRTSLRIAELRFLANRFLNTVIRS